MMVHAGLHENFKTGMWTEYVTTTTKRENSTVKPHEEKYAYNKLYGKIPDYARYLRSLG